MSTSMLLGLFDWIGDFFQAMFDFIPKIIYLFYASLASLLDVLQLFFRKLAGLDVYYIDGEAVGGDLITNFIAGIFNIHFEGADTIDYSPLSTVFWSFVIFGVILCFACTLVAIIKSHYSYDEKAAKGPMQYVYAAGKAIINMVAMPVSVVLGLYVSQALLTALDSLTSVTNGTLTTMYGEALEDNCVSVSTTRSQTDTGNSREQTYIFYDLFGVGSDIFYGSNLTQNNPTPDLEQLATIAATNQTFSGSMFRVAGYNANRARIEGFSDVIVGTYLSGGSGDMTLFENAKISQDNIDYDLFADMVDTAFANNLHLVGMVDLDYGAGSAWVSEKYFTNYLTQKFNCFSKFNVGLIWYFYNLWEFNYIVGFGSVIIAFTIFVNIIMGLITRIFMVLGLFLIAPAIFGISPLDGGKGTKSWIENFLKQVLMAYGAVVGMNIFFLILPYINQIDFFNIPVADYFAQTLIIIVGLITIKAFIGTISGLIGAADANESGAKISEEVGQVAGKAVAMTAGVAVGTAKVAGKLGFGALNVATGGKLKKGVQNVTKKIKNKATGQDKIDEIEKFKTKDRMLKELDGQNKADFNENDFRAAAKAQGLSDEEADNMVNAVKDSSAIGGKLNLASMRDNLAQTVDSKGRLVSRDKDYERQLHRNHWDVDANLNNASRAAQHEQSRRLTRARNVGKAFNSVRGTIGGAFSLANEVVKDDKFTSTFLDKSGIRPKPNFEKETAANTRAANRKLEELDEKLDQLNRRLPPNP